MTLLDLLVMVFPMQAKMCSASFPARGYCWLMFSLLYTRTDRSFSTKLQSGPQPVLVHGVVLPYSALPTVDFHKVPVDPFLQPI